MKPGATTARGSPGRRLAGGRVDAHHDDLRGRGQALACSRRGRLQKSQIAAACVRCRPVDLVPLMFHVGPMPACSPPCMMFGPARGRRPAHTARPPCGSSSWRAGSEASFDRGLHQQVDHVRTVAQVKRAVPHQTERRSASTRFSNCRSHHDFSRLRARMTVSVPVAPWSGPSMRMAWRMSAQYLVAGQPRGSPHGGVKGEHRAREFSLRVHVGVSHQVRSRLRWTAYALDTQPAPSSRRSVIVAKVPRPVPCPACGRHRCCSLLT